MTTLKGKTSTARVRESNVRGALPHLGTAERAEIARIVDVLVRAFEPEAINLFGSQDAGAFPHRLAQEAYRLIGHYLVPLDMVFMSQSEFAWRSGVPTSLPATIVREGKLLYGAIQSRCAT